MHTRTVLVLADGYSRAKQPETREFVAMTPEEAKTVTGTIYFTADFRTYRQCRTNGRAKTWKTRPGEVELPLKYGMYECARATSSTNTEIAVNGVAYDVPVMRLPNGGILLIPVHVQTS